MIILFGVRSEDVVTRNLACAVLVDIESMFPGLMKKMFSRRELEEALLGRLEATRDGRETIQLLQACSACCRQLNIRPQWDSTPWSFPLHWSRRTILSPEVTKLISRLLTRIEYSISPTGLHVFALSVGLSVNLMKIIHKEPSLTETSEALSHEVIKAIPRGKDVYEKFLCIVYHLR